MSRAGQSLRSAATIVGTAMVLSRILGFLRNSVISALFGQGRLTDAFNAAYLVPDTVYMVLIGGGISSAFIPVLSRYIASEDPEEGWRFTSIAFNAVAVVMIVVISLGILFAPWYLQILLPGFPPGKLALTIGLTRITLASIFFHSLNGVLIGTEYAYNTYWGTAVGPLAYNLVIIAVGVVLAAPLGIYAFAWSTLVGSFVNFLIQLIGVLRIGARYHPSLWLSHPGIKRTVRLIVPVMIGLSIAQLNLMINQSFLASTLPQGSLNALVLASRVMLVPIMFAISIGITLLPNLTRQAAVRDLQGFRRTFANSLRAVLFISIPASVGLLVLARPIIEVLFQHGAFTSHATDVTASTLVYYAIGIVGYGAYEIIARGFYALEDTRTPVRIGVAALLVGIGLNFLFLNLFRGLGVAGGADGLALAYSVTGLLNAFLLLFALRRKVGSLGGRSIARTTVRSTVATLWMVAALLVVEWLLPHFLFGPHLVQLALILVFPMVVGGVVFIVAARLLGAEEAGWLIGTVLRRVRRA